MGEYATMLWGEVGGVEVGRALGAFTTGHAQDALGTIFDRGEDRGMGGDALADERARADDAFDRFREGGARAGIADQAVEGLEIGGEGIIPGGLPVHRNTSSHTGLLHPILSLSQRMEL